MYLYAGAADVAALTDDKGLTEAVDRIWDNVVDKKTYVTGGIGAKGQGEAFGKNYELPNRTAYCETCANLATCYWNDRMFLLHGDAKYIDVLERALYNSVISGVSLDGKEFFYPNPLSVAGRLRPQQVVRLLVLPDELVPVHSVGARVMRMRWATMGRT